MGQEELKPILGRTSDVYRLPEVQITGGNMDIMSNDIGQIALALSKAQGEFEAAKKDSKGYGYNYSDLASVISAVKPILAKHNLAVSQLVGQTDGAVSVTTVLSHGDSGQYFISKATLPVIEMKGCNVAQGAGASLSYLRRYALQAILGIASEDNDASSNPAPKKSFTKPAAKKEEKAEPAKKNSSFRRKTTVNNDL